MSIKEVTKVGVVDDHKLFRRGLITLLQDVDRDIHVIWEADNGADMQVKLAESGVPDMVLMDINMPVMDGYKSVEWLKNFHPAIKTLVVSTVENEESIMRMVKMGVKGYLSKDVDLSEFNRAIHAIAQGGFYYTDYITGKLVHSLQFENGGNEKPIAAKLTDKELRFVQLACSDKTYNEIAAEMYLSPKTIDGYRVNVFEKLNVKSRVALALFAVKHGLVQL